MRHSLPIGASLLALSLVAAMPALGGIVAISLDPNSSPSSGYLDRQRTTWDTSTGTPVLVRAVVVASMHSAEPATVLLDGQTNAVDPIYPWEFDVQNDSYVAWTGIVLGIYGKVNGALYGGFQFEQPATATAKELDPDTWDIGAPVFTTQTETTANEIIFSGGTLAPGAWMAIQFDADVPVDANWQILNPLTPLVPEPASLSLLGLGVLGLLGARHKRTA